MVGGSIKKMNNTKIYQKHERYDIIGSSGSTYIISKLVCVLLFKTKSVAIAYS
jgi:hypothetical protein